MDLADEAEDASVRRFARFEWLLGQIRQAAREADAHMRLDHALKRAGEPAPDRVPRHHMGAA